MVSDDGSVDAVVASYLESITIGSICGVALCLLFVAICSVVVYINNTQSGSPSHISTEHYEQEQLNMQTNNLQQHQQEPSPQTSKTIIRDAKGRIVDPDRRVTNLPPPNPRQNRAINHTRVAMPHQYGLSGLTDIVSNNQRIGHRQTSEMSHIEISIVIPSRKPTEDIEFIERTPPTIFDGTTDEKRQEKQPELLILRDSEDASTKKAVTSQLCRFPSEQIDINIEGINDQVVCQ
eukprot:CAMPEP_0202707460 /NCGR_PEP_ID=MMETSP1385-20130828/19792_1 /ASSEMBLY_ACC=CAM_ASM_000861 /TAXON_ID=933848 /ORGANISM="Elphidium margaritaceum" /LENGTH=234 /DNA_ID=CAMNT_0049366185 /DNA_START=79 /DNA_END=783 /DNA_ORIENTATION=-